MPELITGSTEAAEAAAFDVVVVGYGPVGMAMAALMGRAGHRVLVLERYAGLYHLPRAAIFDDETMRTFGRFGIARDLLPKLHVQRNYEWRNGAGQLLIEHDFAEVGRSGWAEWYMMYQPDLEEALDGVCRRAPRVEIRHDSAVVAVEQDDTGVALTVDGPEGTYPVAARFVVGCDGGNSFVRRALGVAQDDYGFSEPWMVCDFRFLRSVRLPAALQLGDPASPTSIISLGPSHHRFSFMLDSVGDFENERDPERVWARVADRLSPDDAELIRVATYTFRSLVAQRWRVGRVVLAGDAAHQMPPFLGQGMCSGIRDAQNIAWKLDLILGGHAAVDLLDTYQIEREPHVRAVTEKGIELGRMQTIRDPEQAAARDRVLLARRVAAERPESIRFPGLAGGFLAARSGPGRGDLAHQGVVAGRAGRDRLDQVLGDGFHLIVEPALLPELDRGGLLTALVAAGVRVAAPGAQPGGHLLTVVDVEGTYRRWFAELGCSAVVVRPDLYVYGTASGPAAVAALVEELLGGLGRLPVPHDRSLAQLHG